MNLKYETLKALKDHGRTEDDIVYVGTNTFRIPLEDFWELANVDYDNGYGGAEIVEDIIVVGRGWWLERHEYDGSEWWEYKECPPVPSRVEKVSSILANGWGTLSDNIIEEEE